MTQHHGFVRNLLYRLPDGRIRDRCALTETGIRCAQVEALERVHMREERLHPITRGWGQLNHDNIFAQSFSVALKFVQKLFFGATVGAYTGSFQKSRAPSGDCKKYLLLGHVSVNYYISYFNIIYTWVQVTRPPNLRKKVTYSPENTVMSSCWM